MKKKVLSTILAGVLALSAFAGCGSSAEESTDTSAVTKEETTVAATEETVSAESTESTDTAAEGGTIKVAASATPHAEILEEAKKILADEGWDLEIKIFDDYVMPNEVVESGEFDANYFQHIPYLESFNKEKGTHLVNAGGIHYEPFGIYPGTKSDLSELADGDTIAVPNDTTNEARALLLLQDNGIITLKEGAGLEATVNDIAENPHNVKIEELAAEQVARVAPEVAFVVLNGNYALQAGFSVAKDALAYEASDSEAAKTYVNIIAVKEGHAKAIMTSYNEVNEEYANENKKLLVDILRKEWGFDGLVVTDWGGSNDHVKGVMCQSDLEMPAPGLSSARELVTAVKEGCLSMEAFDLCVDQVLDAVLNLSKKEETKKTDFDQKSHHALAKRAAAESAVLLKNE